MKSNKKLIIIKKAGIVSLCALFVLSGGCSRFRIEPYTHFSSEEEPVDIRSGSYKYLQYKNLTPEEIVEKLTLEQKAAQMVQPACYNVDEKKMKEHDYGSILSKSSTLYYYEWQNYVDGFQNRAISSESGIPYLYGQDDVHGVNYCLNSVIFPHNIGMGAANDPELMYKVGLITADEAKLCHMLWNFSPCVAQSVDPRWGRTYESYGADLEIIKSLSVAYTKGLKDGGVVACAKHFFADGNVVYGSGEDSDVSRLIDRGDAVLSDAEIKELLSVYQAQIDAGVQTIMISHSSLNGVKMHENAQYIQYLKNEMGFEGFIVSDWNSIQNTSPETYYDQVVTSVNAGIDMLMEVDLFDEAMYDIINAVKAGDITEERVDDAVTRIVRVKKEAGIFDDPFFENLETVKSETGSDEYRAVAKQLVEESLVLVKNKGDVLPLKEGCKVYMTGPAMDNAPAQCGGWTIDWNKSQIENIEGVTTILDGFMSVASEKGITVTTDSDEAEDADVILLVVGEDAYAEWNGDTPDLDLCGKLGLKENEKAIKEAAKLKKKKIPVVTLIVAGRNVLISEYEKDWDAIVMCYLPGSEGDGVAEVVCGNFPFSGKLPSPWYGSLEEIGTEECMYPKGFGLTY
ncbi:MAG: glycoside hydrolase family 3 protein [Lachnospiraceae bacterium]|nr:glycoside hydrolase family 3 protein [Lachnospiraceae bacterium]